MYSGKKRKYSVYVDGTRIGEITAVLSHRSSEERADYDVSRATETVIGITKRNEAVTRGAILEDSDGVKTEVSYAVHAGRFTVLHLTRVMFDGDGGIG